MGFDQPIRAPTDSIPEIPNLVGLRVPIKPFNGAPGQKSNRVGKRDCEL